MWPPGWSLNSFRAEPCDEKFKGHNTKAQVVGRGGRCPSLGVRLKFENFRHQRNADVCSRTGMLLLLMTFQGATQCLLKWVVDQIETRRNDEAGGIGWPGTPASRAPTARSGHAGRNEGPGRPFSHKHTQ